MFSYEDVYSIHPFSHPEVSCLHPSIKKNEGIITSSF
jgi:hypothetical protein